MMQSAMRVEGSYPTDVANLAIQKFMEWEKKHYDIYPKDTPLTMKERLLPYSRPPKLAL
jgi:hypothetical protein